MSPEAKIRKEARARLSNNQWGRGVAITVALLSVPLFYMLFFEMLFYLFYPQTSGVQTWDFMLSPGFLVCACVVALLCWVFYSVLRLGATRWEYQVSLGQSPSAQELFYYFTNGRLFSRAMRYFVAVPLRLGVYLVLLCLPGGAIIGYCVTFGIANTFVGSLTGWASAGILLGSFLLVAGVFLFIPISLRFFSARTAIAAFEDWEVTDCVSYSVQCMRDHKASAFLLMLSFLGWLLLGYFVIPLLGVLPYYRVSLTTSSKWLLGADQPIQEQSHLQTYLEPSGKEM